MNEVLNLRKRRYIAGIMSSLCCFPLANNSVSAFDSSSLANSQIKDDLEPVVLNEESSGNSFEDTSCGIDFISFKKFDELREKVLASLFKYRRDHEQNTYDISGTWNRCVSARFKNGDVVNRMLECYNLFEQEGEHKVSCWDCALANFYYIKNYVFPKFLSEDQIARLKMGMITYLIPVSMGLANHVFSYIYLDGYLLIFDPIEGTANETIDFNFVSHMMGASEGIVKQIKTFYETLSYTVAYEKETDEGVKKYYETNCRLLDIFNFFGRTDGKYGEMTTYFSEDLMNNDHKLSNLKWMVDSEFFPFLANKGEWPRLGYFESTNPGMMFG